MRLFEYKPLNIPLIEALPEKLMADRRAKLGELSIFEQEQQALASVIDLPGNGGELSLQRTVTEAMGYNASRRIATVTPIRPELPDYGNDT